MDGLHTYAQSLRDIENCLKYLNPDGFIVVHDCNPTTSAMAWPARNIAEAAQIKPEGWDGSWCGDVWKSIVYLRSMRNDLNVFVLDCDFGVGIITKSSNSDPLNFSAGQIAKMDYSALESQRRHLLNLKPADYFSEYIKLIF